ncbi:MAG: thioredoxin domain-containing protein [Rhodospirillales bacterium]|nr:thioredoxin domain-containing protein [Rhodospirillales bacterium]
MSSNRLADETSPYLLQHKNNPVHWQPWGPETLAAAQKENKPILLSIGYAACHWCHVMAHESFEDEAIAQTMNELFINIKVDREERPDLDAIYQTALGLLGEHGGWPLTMFLTPAGEPFWGGTYFPATAKFGRPGFPDVLRGIANTYRTENDKVLQNVTAIKDAMVQMSRPESGNGLSIDRLDETAAMALGAVDRHRGGTQGAPKFPQVSFFRFLWRTFKRTGNPDFRDAVTVTLDHICQGGIYDHLGGGFARYSTDGEWLAPHFEKMLYDNALLIDLMCEVWRDTHSLLYQTRIRETIDWSLREMKVDGGDGTCAFASAYDADSEGEEGKFYVWSEKEIDACLGENAAAFKAAYDVSAGGNWEGKNILNRSRRPDPESPEMESLLAACRAKLLALRGHRPWPLWDDKVLADWNGLMIASLARAGMVFDVPEWIAAGEAAFAFILRTHGDGERLYHSWRNGRRRGRAVLDDYANLSRAAVALFEATAKPEYLAQAEAWVKTANRHYWDDERGGYYLSADDTDDVIVRSKTAADNATPSGNGTLGGVLARLYALTGNEEHRDRAEALIRAFSGGTAQHLVNQPETLNAFGLLDRPVQVVIVGDGADANARDLFRAAAVAPGANRTLQRVPRDAELPLGHPAQGKGEVVGRAAAYICIGPRCGLPMTDADQLRRELAAL